MDNSHEIIVARHRSAIYGLLCRVFQRETDEAFLKSLLEPAVFDSLIEAGLELERNELSKPDPKTARQRLSEEYARLFVVPPHRIPLNESVYRSDGGDLEGPAATEVKSFIRRLGLSLDTSWTGLTDHLSLELEIMRLLTEKEAESLEGGDPEAIQRSRRLQWQFISSHLSRWMPLICPLIQKKAETALYREMAAATEVFIKEELENLEPYA